MPTSTAASKNSVLIVAGEASSCLYAQRLLEHWRAQNLDIEAFGVGNADMMKLGFEALGRAEEMAVVGIQEVLAHWSVISGAFHKLVAAAQARRPSFALLLDYPGFNLRLAKRLKALGIPVVYYISPQLWAWRKGRIHQIRKLVDKMLVVFPFEKPFYESHQVNVEFVGHPLLDELASVEWDSERRAYHRRRFGIENGTICLGLMPGSRSSEMKHHLQTQLQAAQILYRQNSKILPALFVAPSLSVDSVRAQLPDMDLPLQLIQAPPFEMIQMADVILCASGTATLMVGLMKVPMVIMYRMNPISATLAKLLVRSTPYFGMVNLISQRLVVPELFQGAANPERLSSEIQLILQEPQRREEMVNSLAQLRLKLGDKGATERVTQAVRGYWR